MRIFTILLFLLVSVVPAMAENFILNADGYVADLDSGLVWQGSSRKFESSRAAADFCARVDSKNNYYWRLPTQAELADLDLNLQTIAPSIYWVGGNSALKEGVYCFGDGAYFQSAGLKEAALARCVSDNPLAPVIEAVNVWVESWQTGDIEAYLSSYVSDFKPRRDIKHSIWEQQRRKRFSSVAEISIELQTEEINPLNDKFVEIVFLQDYRSRNYRDRVRKRLLLSRQRGRWLIAREEQLTSLTQQALSANTIYYQ
jgi:hypothetical protein